MASSRNATASEFRLVLSRLSEVQDKLNASDQSLITVQLSQLKDTTLYRLLKKNQADFLDADLEQLKIIQTRIETGFKAIKDRITVLERKVMDCPAVTDGSVEAEMLTPPSSSRKRKITRHPNLSVSNLKHIVYNWKVKTMAFFSKASQLANQVKKHYLKMHAIQLFILTPIYFF